MPSSRHSADTDVSRCAIAAWASRTWAFDSANFLPPFRPRALAALSPATVRSRILVQGLAYGITFIFVWEIRGQIQDILDVVESLPGAAIDAIDPGRFFGGDR